jgi:hypothetical protein
MFIGRGRGGGGYTPGDKRKNLRPPPPEVYRHADKLYLGDNRAVDESAIWADGMDLLADTRDDGEVLKRNPVKIRLQHSRYGTSAKLLRMNVKTKSMYDGRRNYLKGHYPKYLRKVH